MLKAFKPRGGPSISHILYADDRVLVARAICIKATIDTYCTLSRQAVNFNKSQITFSPSTSPSIKYQIKASLQVAEKGGTLDYLGASIFGKLVTTTDVNYLLEKDNSKIEY